MSGNAVLTSARCVCKPYKAVDSDFSIPCKNAKFNQITAKNIITVYSGMRDTNTASVKPFLVKDARINPDYRVCIENRVFF